MLIASADDGQDVGLPEADEERIAGSLEADR
jgi:hypothetical protein